MDINTESPPASEDRAEVVSTSEDKSSPVIAAEDNMPGSEESSPGKKRRSKDIIGDYLVLVGLRIDMNVDENICALILWISAMKALAVVMTKKLLLSYLMP